MVIATSARSTSAVPQVVPALDPFAITRASPANSHVGEVLKHPSTRTVSVTSSHVLPHRNLHVSTPETPGTAVLRTRGVRGLKEKWGVTAVGLAAGGSVTDSPLGLPPPTFTISNLLGQDVVHWQEKDARATPQFAPHVAAQEELDKDSNLSSKQGPGNAGIQNNPNTTSLTCKFHESILTPRRLNKTIEAKPRENTHDDHIQEPPASTHTALATPTADAVTLIEHAATPTTVAQSTNRINSSSHSSTKTTSPLVLLARPPPGGIAQLHAKAYSTTCSVTSAEAEASPAWSESASASAHKPKVGANRCLRLCVGLGVVLSTVL